MLAHVPSFGRNPRGSPDFLAYPVPKACMHALGTRVPRCLGVARSASSPKAALALGCSLTPGLQISFGRVTCMARAASVPGLWALGFLLLACVGGWVRVAVGRGFCFHLPVVAGVLGGCVWARFVVLSLFCWLLVVFVVGLWCRPAFGTCVVSCAFPLPPAVSGSGVRCGRACWARVSAVPRPSWLGCRGVFLRFFFFSFFFFFRFLGVPVPGLVVSPPVSFLFGWAAGFFFVFLWVSACFGAPFPGGPLFLAWCCRFLLGGLPVPVWGSCLRCLLGGGFGLLLCFWRAVWWLCVAGVLVGSLATPGGGSCVLLPATPGWVSLLVVAGGPRHSWLGSAGGGGVWCVVCGGGVLVGLWLVRGVVGPSPLLAEVPVCYSPPLLAGFRCRWWWADPATPGWGPLAALLCGVWCVAVVCWWGCGWCVVWLVPRHSWRRFLCASPRHSWLGLAAGGGGRSPPLLAGVRWRWCCVVCVVWRWCVGGVVAGAWCGWSLATPGGGPCVLLPATLGWVSLPLVVGGPRHSWLVSVGCVAVWCVVCGGGVLVGLWLVCGVVGPSPLLAEVPVCYSPPVLAGFRCRWWWAVPATPGWGPLAAVVCGVWCVVCGGGVLVGLWLLCGVVGPSPLLAVVSLCFSPPLLAGFRCRWWWAVPATPGWGLWAAVVCGVWCVVVVCCWGCGWCVACGGGVLLGLWLVCGVVGPSPLLAVVPVCYSPTLLAGFRCRWWWVVPATPGWGPLAAVVCGVWCVVCWWGPSPLLAVVPVCYSPPLLAGFRWRRWCVVCGVWCVAVVCCWGCGWCVVWLVPRHSWRRSLCATPRHSWLGFAAGGGGRSPPLVAGVRWRRWCVVCGVWCVAVVCCWGCGWCVVWLVPRHSSRRSLCATPRHSWLGFAAGGGGRSPPLLAGVRWRRWSVVCGVLVGSLATPGGGSCVLLPATPGWVSLPLVVGGPRHSWLGSAGGRGVWCTFVCVLAWPGRAGRPPGRVLVRLTFSFGRYVFLLCLAPSGPGLPLSLSLLLPFLVGCFSRPPAAWLSVPSRRVCVSRLAVLLFGGCSPAPLPFCVSRFSSLLLGALVFLLFFFSSFFFFLCAPPLSLVFSGFRPRVPWASALALFALFAFRFWALRALVALSCFPPGCWLLPRGCCLPPLCVSRFSFLPLGAVCRVVLCFPGCGAAPRCCALCRPVFCCRVLCCARVVPLLVAPCPLALPVALGPCALRRCVLRCSPALCALCCVCSVVARWCVLLFAALPCAVCVPGCCAVRSLSSLFCAVLCSAVLVRSCLLFVWCVLLLAPGAVVRCCVLCCFLWCAVVRCWVWWPVVVCWWRFSVSVSLSGRVVCFPVVPCFPVSCSVVLCCRVVLCCCALVSCCGAVGACFALLWAVVPCCVVLLVRCAVFGPVVVSACCGALFLVLCVPCLLRSVRSGALLCWLWCPASLCRVLWRCAVVWCCAVVLRCCLCWLCPPAACRAAPVWSALLLVPRAVAYPCALWCLPGRSAVWWCCSGVSWCLAVLCVVLWCPAPCAVSCGAVLPCGAVLFVFPFVLFSFAKNPCRFSVPL